ncbi:type II secretion system protein [Sedimentisphaera salicampi]|uniref:PilD-dependent protein PddA n=1 Tax=Sedimentisphaera salicampi TaxID=1941349 RepID=A0A1W6LQD5_9BACT|nr:prepilin-type N-terminal cleavage/methylation domain-containing protein [Sedimentisphaera salicampi]ARN57990.1 PilD-dependent protein PddA [Sedimentisphaera salicampi]OXU14155.1 PilD-dependent protein PddA [Sedimentisphaera salicampi]
MRRGLITKAGHKSGFTLIELLVVISIIALLMAILMPALGKAREQAQRVVCKSNIKQVGTAMNLYSMDNEDKFASMSWQSGDYWFQKISSYIGDDDDSEFKGDRVKVMLCPSAEEHYAPTDVPPSKLRNYFYPEMPGGTIKADENWNWRGNQGSYGLNNWLTSDYQEWEKQFGKERFYRKWSELEGRVPLVGDSIWVGAFPDGENYVPTEPETRRIQISGDFDQQMRRFSIDRHNMNINLAFSDLSVESVELEDLWSLQWNKLTKIRRDVEIEKR